MDLTSHKEGQQTVPQAKSELQNADTDFHKSNTGSSVTTCCKLSTIVQAQGDQFKKRLDSLLILSPSQSSRGVGFVPSLLVSAALLYFTAQLGLTRR